MGWGRGNDGWGGWPRYVPVAERQEKARKQAEKLSKKKGVTLSPVTVAGRAIASSFWGKAWCQNLEKYSDYANRIPRGRTYVRNGSVIDLKILPGVVNAQVSGTHLYAVKIAFKPLRPEIWLKIKRECTGKIASLIELLQGKLSKEVMEIVTKQRTGLFPEPSEISFDCSCPDSASMCKHIAATLYGIGARLDEEPELLFLLRGVDHLELIAAPEAQVGLAASPDLRERKIAEEDISSIFGIDIDTDGASSIDAPPVKETPPVMAIPASAKKNVKTARQAATTTLPEPASSRQGLTPKSPQSATVSPEPTPTRRGRTPKPQPARPSPTRITAQPASARATLASASQEASPSALQSSSALRSSSRPAAESTPMPPPRPKAPSSKEPPSPSLPMKKTGRPASSPKTESVAPQRQPEEKTTSKQGEEKFKRRKAFIEAARKFLEEKNR